MLVASLHGDPGKGVFPLFWGAADETGIGDGAGYNANFPLPLSTKIESYLQTLELALDRIRDFEPDYLVVSLGYDLVDGDPYGSFQISVRDLEVIGAAIGQLELKTLLIQEGGYQLDNISDCAESFLSGLSRTYGASTTIVKPDEP